MKIIEFLKVFRKTFLTPLKVRKSYSQFAEDLIVDQYFGDYLKQGKKGFYVDVGSHHPKRGSNTYRLYKGGWRGILIDMEDNKVLAAKMARPRDTVVKAAISDKEELVSIYSQSSFSTNATISKDLISKNSSFTSVGSIMTMKLYDLLIKNNCPMNFDFLNLDIEGNDYKAIDGALLNAFRPKLICIENYSAEQGIEVLINSTIHKLLVSKDYVLTSISGPSTFYISI